MGEFLCVYACVSKCLCSFDCIHYHVIITMSTCVSFETVLIIKKYGSCINKKLSKIRLDQWFPLSNLVIVSIVYMKLLLYIWSVLTLDILQTHFLYQRYILIIKSRKIITLVLPLILFQRSTGINHD